MSKFKITRTMNRRDTIKVMDAASGVKIKMPPGPNAKMISSSRTTNPSGEPFLVFWNTPRVCYM